MRNSVSPSSCVTPAGTSNKPDVQNKWEKKTHTHTHIMIDLVSPIKYPAWQPLLNPVYLKREKRVTCTHGIAKFGTGAFYLTCTKTINDLIWM